MDWLNQLEPELRASVEKCIAKNPELKQVFTNVYQAGQSANDVKRRKVVTTTGTPEFDNTTGIFYLTTPISPETVIMDIQQVLFQHPLRKRLNFIFHLLEKDGEPYPVLSIVNPTTNIPELLAINLDKTIKLAVLLPIVGNTTLPKKKNLALLCLWINPDRMGEVYAQKGGEPIVCQINLEQIKKVLVKAGKMPNNIESQYEPGEEEDVYLHPIQEHIVNYFTRQFGLCGVTLHNYLPCKATNIFNLNTDQALAIAPIDDASNNGLIMTAAYKGSKEGVLVFFQGGTIIFGFKKPILVFDVTTVKHISYTNVTRITFSLNITVEEAGAEKTHEFSMIDQQYFAVIDDFIKKLSINDALFDQKLKEKGDKEEDVKEDDDDDDEDDGDFVGGGGDDDVAEEYDSGHESEDAVHQVGAEEEE